jgi:predicted nucleotidyltransferase
MNKIMTVLVGSKAHGLDNPYSDEDKRFVFVEPTSEVLKLRDVKEEIRYLDGNIDDVGHEVKRFLQLAMSCNPSILECFLAPTLEVTEEGEKLRALFPYVWNSKGVKNAFLGYAMSQRKKMLHEGDTTNGSQGGMFKHRQDKNAAAYLRTLYNGWELLTTGTFSVRIVDTPIGKTVWNYKNGFFSYQEVMDTCLEWEDKLKGAYESNPDKQSNIEKVNEFLLDLRKNNW